MLSHATAIIYIMAFLGYSLIYRIGDAQRLPEGQRSHIPTWAFFPSIRLSLIMVLVRRETVTYKGNRLTHRRKKVYIPLMVFLLSMLLPR